MEGKMSPLTYLLIGHISKDLLPEGPRLGGAVTFCGLTTAGLGLSSVVVTSAADSDAPLLKPLQHIHTIRIPSTATTTFVNHYTEDGRYQTISGHAEQLNHTHIPREWQNPEIVHFAPVANEVDEEIVRQFPHSFRAATPQGWMRRWDEKGAVYYEPWLNADKVLPQVHVAVMSIEDVRGDEDAVQHFADMTPCMVVTRGAKGCTIFTGGQEYTVPTGFANEVDPTGAGDIFAASFVVHYYSNRDPLKAARFANYIAGESIKRIGLEGIPSEEIIKQAYKR